MSISAGATDLVRMRTELRHWRGGAALLLGCVVLGCLQGVLWSLIAPGEQFKVFKDGTWLPLPTESTHQYTAVALFTMIAIVAGLAIAVAAWSWRSLRGTVMLLAVGFANGVGALAAYLVGRVLAAGVDPASVGPSSVESVVRAAPVSGSAIVLIIQPAIAVAVYTFLVAWNGMPNLGREDAPFAGPSAERTGDRASSDVPPPGLPGSYDPRGELTGGQAWSHPEPTAGR